MTFDLPTSGARPEGLPLTVEVSSQRRIMRKSALQDGFPSTSWIPIVPRILPRSEYPDSYTWDNEPGFTGDIPGDRWLRALEHWEFAQVCHMNEGIRLMALEASAINYGVRLRFGAMEAPQFQYFTTHTASGDRLSLPNHGKVTSAYKPLGLLEGTPDLGSKKGGSGAGLEHATWR